MSVTKATCRNRLRVILAEQEKTNRWLAEQMGVSEITVSRWTTNKIQPSMQQCVALTQILNVKLDDLVEPYSEEVGELLTTAE